jgi:hypothetical protein
LCLNVWRLMHNIIVTHMEISPDCKWRAAKFRLMS